MQCRYINIYEYVNTQGSLIISKPLLHNAFPAAVHGTFKLKFKYLLTYIIYTYNYRYDLNIEQPDFFPFEDFKVDSVSWYLVL